MPVADHPVLPLLLAGALVVLMHIATIAAVGSALGARLLLVTFGVGPWLWRTPRFQLRALPIGGSVRFLHSVDDQVPEGEEHRALDRRPAWAQLATLLSGCAALLALAFALLGAAAVAAFLALPGQLFGGAVSPFGDAQALLQEAALGVRASSFPALLGVVAAKVAALNLLPLPFLNGGAALAVLGRRLGLARLWPVAATRTLMCVWVMLALAWLAALGSYLMDL